jgi:hypothetical protein
MHGFQMRVKGEDFAEKRGIIIERNRRLPGQPSEDIAVYRVQQILESLYFPLIQTANICVSELAEQKIILAHAPVPRPEQNTAPPGL